MSLRFAMIGTGALGGYYGAKLHHAGFSTHFVLHKDFSHVQEYGLRVDSIDGDLSIAQPLIASSVLELPLCDVLCLSLKSTANHRVLPHLASRLKPGGCVLVLQNGLGIEEEVANWVPGQEVLGGLCFVCSHKIGPGHIHHLDYGGIMLAPLHSHSPWLSQLAQVFVQAGVETQTHPILSVARWQKLMWNIPFNGLCTLLCCDTAHLMSQEAGITLCRELMLEIEQASIACGSPVAPGLVDKLIQQTQRMKPYLPSMRLDRDRAQPLEIDAIYDRSIERARQHGFDMTRTRFLRDQLRLIR